MAAATRPAFQDFPCCLISRFCTGWPWRDYARRPPKHDSGLHLDRLPVPPIRLEFPLVQSVSDHPCLIGECAKKMNVLYLAFLVDDDSDRNRVKPMFGKNRVNPCDHVFIANVVLDANRDSAPTTSAAGTGFLRQLHPVHVQDQALQQFAVTAGQHDLQSVAADLSTRTYQ